MNQNIFNDKIATGKLVRMNKMLEPKIVYVNTAIECNETKHRSLSKGTHK